jgi:beta-lactamase class A
MTRLTLMRIILTIFALLALIPPLTPPLHAQQDTALASQLAALIAPYQGDVSVYAIDLRSGRSVAIDADTPVPTASVIKLAVLFEALKQIQEGRVHLGDRLTMTKADQVPGSGVIQLFDTPMTLTLKDALTMMITQSDNTATNLVIEHLGLANIDRRIGWLGLHDTWLYKEVFRPPSGPVPPDQPQFGLGKTTAREMAELMGRFATCDLNEPGTAAAPTPQERQLCDAALFMLRNQSDQESIPRYLSTLQVANKTGALDAVRNDVGIVYAPNGPIVISLFTNHNKDESWTVDNAAYLLMARLAWTIVERWN